MPLKALSKSYSLTIVMAVLVIARAAASDNINGLNLEITTLRDSMVTAEPLLVACEWRNSGTANIDLRASPVDLMEVLVSRNGGPFVAQHSTDPVGPESDEPYVIAKGTCDRAIVVLFKDASAAPGLRFIFGTPGRYEVKARVAGVESNVLSVAVTACSNATYQAIREVAAVDNNAVLLPMGVASVRNTDEWERLVKAESTPTFLADYMHCILARHYFGLAASRAIRSGGKLPDEDYLSGLRHCRAVGKEQRMLCADALLNMESAMTAVPDAIPKHEWQHMIREIQTRKSDLRWVLPSDWSFCKILRELQQYSLYEVADRRLNRKVMWEECAIGDWCQAMQRQTGVNLIVDASLIEHLVLSSHKQTTLRRAMVEVSVPDNVWIVCKDGYELQPAPLNERIGLGQESFDGACGGGVGSKKAADR